MTAGRGRTRGAQRMRRGCASASWAAAARVFEIDARFQSLVNASPSALDTLKEFADALGNDANFAATITGQLANRLRFDTTQTLSEAQQIQALTNLGLGDILGTDFAANYRTART